MKKDFHPIYQKEKAYQLQLQQDLKNLLGKLEKTAGVSRAAIISANDIIVDDKVRWKCKYPVCFGYGSSILCPPHTPPVDECKRIIHSFRYALIFQHDVPVEDFTSNSASAEAQSHFPLTNEIAGQVESWANHMGYRQAVAFQGGMCPKLLESCRKSWLGNPNETTDLGCAVLQGKKCRHHLQVRPSMEAMAIDVIGTVLPLGWDLVYIGHQSDPADVPCASTVGLLLVT